MTTHEEQIRRTFEGMPRRAIVKQWGAGMYLRIPPQLIRRGVSDPTEMRRILHMIWKSAQQRGVTCAMQVDIDRGFALWDAQRGEEQPS